jgi:hypothetical protein
MTMAMTMRMMRTLTTLRSDLCGVVSLFGILMPKGRSTICMCFHLDLSWFPFGFGRVTSSYRLLACLCPIVELKLDYLLLCVELCAILCV